MHRPKTVVIHHNRSSKGLERRVWFTDRFFWRGRGDGNLRDRRIKDMWHRWNNKGTRYFSLRATENGKSDQHRKDTAIAQ